MIRREEGLDGCEDGKKDGCSKKRLDKKIPVFWREDVEEKESGKEGEKITPQSEEGKNEARGARIEELPSQVKDEEEKEEPEKGRVEDEGGVRGFPAEEDPEEPHKDHDVLAEIDPFLRGGENPLAEGSLTDEKDEEEKGEGCEGEEKEEDHPRYPRKEDKEGCGSSTHKEVSSETPRKSRPRKGDPGPLRVLPGETKRSHPERPDRF
jgi:hypothetical protein